MRKYTIEPYDLVVAKQTIDKIGTDTGYTDLDELIQRVKQKGKHVKVANGEDAIEFGYKVDKKRSMVCS